MRALLSAGVSRLGRLMRRLVKWAVTVLLSIVLGFTLYATMSLPRLQPWHTEILDQEFSAPRDAGLDGGRTLRRPGEGR